MKMFINSKSSKSLISVCLFKVLISIIFSATLTISFISCKNLFGENKNGSKNLKDVTSLFIINPTDKKKNIDETWFTIETSARKADEIDYKNSTQNAPFIEHTIPFDCGNLNEQKLLEEPITRNALAENKTIRYTKYKLGEKLTFEDYDSNFFSGKRTATVKYVGDYCYVWTFNDEPEVSKLTDEQIETFAKKFDKIYLKETALCGPKYNGETVHSGVINPNDKISIVFFDIGNDKANGTVAGYCSYTQFYNNKIPIEPIFVDSYFLKNDNEVYSYSTLTHEFNHMLNYVNKTLKLGLNFNSWYTEMLSMLTEDFFMEDLEVDYDSSVQKRLETFLSTGHRYGFGNWQDINNSSITTFNYANAYAFGAFLARNYGGAKLIHEIATNEYVNEESVVNAVNKINGTNLTFNDLLKEFPAILVNPQNKKSNLPSLYKEQSDSIICETDEYNFHLTAIDLENLSEGVFIKSDDIKGSATANFDSYGFLFYQFKEKTDINLSLKDFLIYSTF
ncbi:MAG: hypothetical protein K6A43_10615 [Treponema sp.]|nr:hypothetical protein [Treponema sp.]